MAPLRGRQPRSSPGLTSARAAACSSPCSLTSPFTSTTRTWRSRPIRIPLVVHSVIYAALGARPRAPIRRPSAPRSSAPDSGVRFASPRDGRRDRRRQRPGTRLTRCGSRRCSGAAALSGLARKASAHAGCRGAAAMPFLLLLGFVLVALALACAGLRGAAASERATASAGGADARVRARDCRATFLARSRVSAASAVAPEPADPSGEKISALRIAARLLDGAAAEDGPALSGSALRGRQQSLRAGAPGRRDRRGGSRLRALGGREALRLRSARRGRFPDFGIADIDGLNAGGSSICARA